MKRKVLQKYLYLGLLLAIFACRETAPLDVQKPEQLLTRQQVADVLVELHLLEAMTTANGMLTDSLTRFTLSQYQAVYKKHHTNDSQFKASFAYYQLQPVEIDSIYADVIQQLSALQPGYNSGINRPVLVNPDSVGNQ